MIKYAFCFSSKLILHQKVYKTDSNHEYNELKNPFLAIVYKLCALLEIYL